MFPSHRVLAYVSAGTGTTGIRGTLFTDPRTGGLTRITVPMDSATHLAAGGADIAYVFGGTARNEVTRIHLSSAQIERDVAELRSPPDSYVVAVDSP